MNNYELLLTILLFIVVNNFFIYLIHSNYFNKCIKALYIYTVSYKYFLNPVFSHKIFNLYTSSIILFFSISNLEEIYSLNLCHMSYAPPIANAVTSLHEWEGNDGFNIKSMLEQNDNSPLSIILSGIISLSIFGLFFNILFLYNLLKKYILKDNKDFILNLINKISIVKYREFLKNKFLRSLEISSRFDLLLFILVFLIILICFVGIIIACTLIVLNLDQFCINHLKFISTLP